jgi:benzoate transport
VRPTIDEQPLSRFQAVAIGLCVVLNALDGFDVLVMAFTASEVAKEWSLSGAALGTLLSAGLFGMAGGSLFIAPWADRYGRRATTLASLCLITLGMLLSSLAQSPAQLGLLRVLTGVGVGGILASLTVITSEYSPKRLRASAIALMTTGYPVGATVGGAIAAFLVTRYGWRSAFLFGALASAAMIPAVARSLPESVDFLLARRPPGALARLNDVLRRMGRPAVAALPSLEADEPERANPLGGLFAKGTAGQTALIWSAFFLLMSSFYFVMSWTPKLLIEAGLSTRQGITGGVLLNLGGILGGILFSSLATRSSPKRLSIVSLGSSAAAMVLLGALATHRVSAFLVAFAVGTMLCASMSGLYALAPSLYPAAFRATGIGWAIGIGRLGAILAPLWAGFLVDRGWDTVGLYAAFALPVGLGMLAVRGLKA